MVSFVLYVFSGLNAIQTNRIQYSKFIFSKVINFVALHAQYRQVSLYSVLEIAVIFDSELFACCFGSI